MVQPYSSLHSFHTQAWNNGTTVKKYTKIWTACDITISAALSSVTKPAPIFFQPKESRWHSCHSDYTWFDSRQGQKLFLSSKMSRPSLQFNGWRRSFIRKGGEAAGTWRWPLTSKWLPRLRMSEPLLLLPHVPSYRAKVQLYLYSSCERTPRSGILHQTSIIVDYVTKTFSIFMEPGSSAESLEEPLL